MDGDNSARTTDDGGLTWADGLLLTVYCAILFGVALISGRALSLHEAVLPQSAREMFADGDYLVPKKGGTPWLESPPLPQWATVALATPFGRCDTEAIVRLGPVLVSWGVVLLVSWMSALWYGRTTGLLAGLVMATTCQFTRYAWLAEDEIYLCGTITLAIAAFVNLEFRVVKDADELRHRGVLSLLFGTRSAAVWGFFLALGMTNLVKGIVFGTVMAGIPMFAFLAGSRDVSRWRKYLWLWGVVTFCAILLAWPVAVWLRYPDVVDVWRFDLGGRLNGSYAEINQPLWYYWANLPWMVAPWTLVIPCGLWITAQKAWRDRASPERFLWAWAFLVPAVFSLPGGKHHHYLLHAMAPWAVLGTLGLQRTFLWFHALPMWRKHPAWSLLTVAVPAVIAVFVFRRKLPFSQSEFAMIAAMIPVVVFAASWWLTRSNPRSAATGLFAMVGVAYLAGHVVATFIVSSQQLLI